LPGVILVYGLEHIQQRWTMVLEDFGGDSLALLNLAGQLDMVDFLTLAIDIADILGRIHQQHIIHKDINPSNIVLNPGTKQVKIIDFGISTVLSRENTPFRNPNVLEGTLAHISPEQTGRMNRVVDYRTDFYSLGVTFYELLTGQLPFAEDTPLELIHSHIAKQPVLPHHIDSTIPPLLSEITMKLMAKNAEGRYQSAFGLKHDLERCLDGVKGLSELGEGPPLDFELAQKDFSGRLTIPQKLYGREKEIDRLLAAFERMPHPDQPAEGLPGSQDEGMVADSEPRTKVMLVSGYSGVGKSALVHEIHRPVTARHGFFIEGKFDQLERSVPYYAWSQAFTALVNQLLMESPERMATWQAAIDQAVGESGQVLVDVIPNLALLIGEPPPVLELGAVQAQRRLNYVMQNLLRVVAQPDHPLVILLDDLQWADAASLDLLQALVTGGDNPHLLIIGAYRDNEITPSHPLSLALRELREQQAWIETLHLGNLSIEHVTQLVTETLETSSALDPAQLRDLANLVYEKTRGNAFFVNQFLRSLDEAELLTFDFSRSRWAWDIEQIRALDVTDNVVEWLAGQARRLPVETLAVLQLAACIGNRFDLRTLAVIVEKTVRETARALQPGLVEGFVLPLDQSYQFADLDVPDLEAVVGLTEYRFVHDRVQQAMYSLAPGLDCREIHLRIGRLLLEDIQREKQNLDEHVFDVVNQWNFGQELLETRADREQLARLNLQAGQKARSAAAFQLAFDYAQTGLGLLDEQSWSHNYDLTLDLHSFATQAAYWSNNYARLEKMGDITLKHTQDVLHRVKVYEAKIQAYDQKGQLYQAVETALEALDLLGISIPQQPDQEQVRHALEEVQTSLANFLDAQSVGSDHNDIEQLLDLPEMTDPYQLAAIRIIADLSGPARIVAPEVFLLTMAKAIRLLVENGNNGYSAELYCLYGIILCGVVKDIATGYQFGQLALTALDRLTAQKREADIMLGVHCMISHWKAPLRETFKGLIKAYQLGLESGDWLVAVAAVNTYNNRSICAGRELADVERGFARFGGFIAQAQPGNHLLFLYWQVVENLITVSENPCILTGTHHNEAAMLPVYVGANNRNSLWHFYLNKFMLSFLFRDYRQATEYATAGWQYADGAIGGIDIPIFCLYDSLTQLALWPSATRDERKGILDKVRANQEKMFAWAMHAPANFMHKYHLVEAERCAVLAQNGEAREQYDKAIALARQHEYLNEEALARELAGEFYLRNEQDELARFYLQNAHYAYLRWGALAKVADLEGRYPQWLVQSGRPDTDTTTTQSTARFGSEGVLDLTTVVKAAQAISSEIGLETLLSKVMKTVLESAGAEKGLLILQRADDWVIEAEGAMDEDQVTVLQSVPVTQAANVPHTLVHYVARTGESVVLDDAANEGQFTQDDYISARQLKSVLCMPLTNQGQISGIVYLENNLSRGAFTPDRLALLNLLSSQMAISLDNSTLYDDLKRYQNHLEELVAERTLRLQAANQAKSVFLANMSHELRTPLNAILGFAQLMARDTHVTPTQQEYLETIARSGEHLLGLINDVLTMSKIEAGRTTLQENAFDLRRQLQGLQEMFQLRVADKGLALLLDVAPDVPRYVYTDEGKLRQVLMNLLSNAVKFTEEGEVTLRVRATDGERRTMDEESKEQPSLVIGQWSLVFEIQDTGTGIAQEEMDALFAPFVQTTSGQQSHEGTGLGLPISRQFVELMGGELGVNSIVGEGTTFRVQMPVALVDEDVAQARDLQPQRRVTGIEPGQTAPDGGPFRILVVEDQTDNRELLVKLLEPFGFNVHCAVDGARGIEMWEQRQPHLVWMDMRLPVMDGYEATRQIKARATATNRQAIVVALTASAFEEDRKAILATGCDDFVRKPFREGEIYDVLHRHLGVRFIYETVTPTPETTAVVSLEDLRAVVETLPAAWVADLYQAAVALDNDQMLALIEAVRPQVPHLSDTLAGWVHGFEYERLIALVAPEK
jgi:predicted ATPase/signal transduction histidine kinase/CheY-like chemotaxis protein